MNSKNIARAASATVVKAFWLCWFVYPVIAIGMVCAAVNHAEKVDEAILVIFVVWLVVTVATIVRLIWDDVKFELGVNDGY
jgi:hypothetical protein